MGFRCFCPMIAAAAAATTVVCIFVFCTIADGNPCHRLKRRPRSMLIGTYALIENEGVSSLKHYYAIAIDSGKWAVKYQHKRWCSFLYIYIVYAINERTTPYRVQSAMTNYAAEITRPEMTFRLPYRTDEPHWQNCKWLEAKAVAVKQIYVLIVCACIR